MILHVSTGQFGFTDDSDDSDDAHALPLCIIYSEAATSSVHQMS